MAKAIFVEIIGNASQFKKELTGAVAATNKANSSFHKVGKAAGIAGLALAGGLAVGLDVTVKAAMHAQESTAKLDQAFKNSGKSADDYSGQIDKAEASSRKLGFTDEQTKDTLAGLMTATGNVKESMRDLAIAQDVSRLKHVDLSTAAKMVTSTLSGNVRSAKALGIILLPVTSHMDALRAKYKALGETIPKSEERTAKFADKQATAAEALKKVTDRVHGQASAFSNTAAGGVAQFHAAIDHLEVKLGKGLIPALSGVVGFLTGLVDFLSKHTTAVKIFAIGIGVLAGAFIALSAAVAIADLVMSPFLVPIIAATIAIGALGFIVYKLVTDFKKNWPLLLPIVLGPLGLIIAAVVHWHSQIAGAFTAAWNAVKGITLAGVHAVVGAITGAIGAATSAASSLGHGILNGIMTVVNTIDNKVKAAFGAVWKALGKLVDTAASAGKEIGAAIAKGFLAGLAGLAKDAADLVRNAIKHLPHINIPGFSPIEHVGFAIGRMLTDGMIRALREGELPFKKQMENLIKFGAKGFSSGGPGAPFTDYLATAKKHTDAWADNVATANMSGVGKKLASAFGDGVVNSGRVQQGFKSIPLRYVPTAGQTQSGTGSMKDLGMGGGGSTTIVMPVYLDGEKIAETTRRVDNRYKLRNGIPL